MADFGKGKMEERNKGKMTNFGREKLKIPSVQSDLIGRGRNRKVIGKLDLISFIFSRDRKLILDQFFNYLDFF